jgi:8-oxo-dGTP diphosphatase
VSPSPPAIEVSAGLVWRDGRLLIAQRKAGTHLGGLWEFPGGKRHPDETWEACLARELREELAIDVQVHGLFFEVRHTYPDKTIHLRFFECSLIRGEPQPIDCAACKWVTHEELGAHEFPAADAALIGRLATG